MVSQRRRTYTCIQCGTEVIGVGRKYCSNACQAAHEYGSNRRTKNAAPTSRRMIRAQAAVRRAERGTHGPRRGYASGPCRRCGDYFTAMVSSDIPAYCSDQCKRGDRRDRRRAAVGENVPRTRRYKIFERDRWICQLCFKPINRTLKVPDRGAPTIDHRIPVNLGGDHSEDNLQAAHFICNSTRGTTPLEVAIRELSMAQDL